MNALLVSSEAATATAVISTTSTAVDEATQFSALPSAIIEAHILTHLDGPSLSSATCSSATLHHLSSQNHLWTRLCHATWPSTEGPPINDVIKQCGPCAFFAQSFPLPLLEPTPTSVSSSHRNRLSISPELLISAVDIFYKDELIFSKTQETETVTGWFRCSPFSIDLLEPKDVVPTRINYPDREDTCSIVAADMKLSWIIVDPKGRRAVNLSSHRPVSVQRHWLSGEMQVRFSSVLAGAGKKSRVQCGIVVTCGRSDGGDMQLREVSLQMEDMDGTHLTGKDILVILQKALEGKRGNAVNREDETKRRYVKYLEMKEESKERKQRAEMALDTMCVTVGICCLVAFCGFLCMW